MHNELPIDPFEKVERAKSEADFEEVIRKLIENQSNERHIQIVLTMLQYVILHWLREEL